MLCIHSREAMMYMKRKKRWRIHGDLFVYFITFVTGHRYPYFQVSSFADVLEEDILFSQYLYRFQLYGYVILHDHVHLMIQPRDHHSYPEIIATIKRNATRDINALARGLPFIRTEAEQAARPFDLTLKRNFWLTHDRYPHITEEAYYSHYARLSLVRDIYNSGRTLRAYTGFRWQSSFHDHVMRDERDYYTHLRYLWRNPVKHGLTASPPDWKYLWVEGQSCGAPGSHLPGETQYRITHNLSRI
jgi:REP element-mobilizing transposase RayT